MQRHIVQENQDRYRSKFLSLGLNHKTPYHCGLDSQSL